MDAMPESGSQAGDDGAATSKTDLKVTTARCCTHCNSASPIRALGRVELLDGMVRSMYCCATCDRTFVFVRRVLG
jgi:hypothetical protein